MSCNQSASKGLRLVIQGISKSVMCASARNSSASVLSDILLSGSASRSLRCSSGVWFPLLICSFLALPVGVSLPVVFVSRVLGAQGASSHLAPSVSPIPGVWLPPIVSPHLFMFLLSAWSLPVASYPGTFCLSPYLLFFVPP